MRCSALETGTDAPRRAIGRGSQEGVTVRLPMQRVLAALDVGPASRATRVGGHRQDGMLVLRHQADS
jgi:hypothetical protein